MKYKLYFIECHNPFNRFDYDEDIDISDEDLRNEGIKRIIEEYNDWGYNARHSADSNDDEWAEFEITIEFEAKNIEEAKNMASELYSGSADVFTVFDEEGKEVFTEEDFN